MKKFLFFAASAIALFASCQKTEINYQNGPQEIAFFAVNKVATKAPVVDATFLDNDEIRVSAFLTATDESNASQTSYFENILFKKSGNDWVGGQYWPLSSASMNFVAVTEVGGAHSLGDDKVSFADSKFTVTLDNNVGTPSDATTAETWNQTDLMYAVGTQTNTVTTGSTPAPVDMKFNHALAWVNFSFKTNVAQVITINSVDLFAGYNGTLIVEPLNYIEVQNTGIAENKKLGVNTSWTVDSYFSKKVSKNHNVIADEMAWADVPTDFTAFGNGLLVVPTAATKTTSNDAPYFVINYTVNQSNADGGTVAIQYSYKHPLTNVEWEQGKKYTYNINMTLHQIEVRPSVDEWDVENPTAVPLG